MIIMAVVSHFIMLNLLIGWLVKSIANMMSRIVKIRGIAGLVMA